MGFLEAGELLKGFSIEANRFHVVAHSPAGIPAVEQHIGREKASGLSLLVGPQRLLMLSQLGMGQACQVRNLTGMGMTVQGGHLIQHLLGAVLADGLIQMGQARLRAVVGWPLALRWINGRKRWPLQGLLGRAELLLGLEQLLLQPGDLEVTITQLLQRIHQGIRVQGGKGADLVASTTRQPIAIGLQVGSIQALQSSQTVFAVGVFPAFGEPLAELIVVALQLLLDPLETFGGQQRLQQRRQSLDQLITIQPLIEQLSLTKPLPLRTQVPIALQQRPMLLQVGQKILEAAGLCAIATSRQLHRGIQRCIGRIGQMQLVVPERQQALSGVACHRQAQPMGVSQQLLLLLLRQLRQGRQLVHIGTVDGQGWAGFTHSGSFFWLPPRGDHGQTLQQGGGDLGNWRDAPAHLSNHEDEAALQCTDSRHPLRENKRNEIKSVSLMNSANIAISWRDHQQLLTSSKAEQPCICSKKMTMIRFVRISARRIYKAMPNQTDLNRVICFSFAVVVGHSLLLSLVLKLGGHRRGNQTRRSSRSRRWSRSAQTLFASWAVLGQLGSMGVLVGEAIQPSVAQAESRIARQGKRWKSIQLVAFNLPGVAATRRLALGSVQQTPFSHGE